MKIRVPFARAMVLAGLVIAAQGAHAIGDSGGCGADVQYARVLAVGSVAEVEAYVASSIERRAGYLDLKEKLAHGLDAARRTAWAHDARKRMLHGQMVCGSLEFPLDHAVGHGNLEVVRWLLDLGVDPNPVAAKRNLFTRCWVGYGRSKELAFERRAEAYRMLVARGANVNALDPFHGTYGCRSREMWPVLRQLGAQVTKEAFVSQVAGVRSAGGSISELLWSDVEQLAKWQAFDFRGTSFEEGLVAMLEARADMPDHGAVLELTRRLSQVVRLSPGIVPGQPARPEEVPARFAPARERCFFPELGAYPDFEFVALWRDGAPGQPSSRTPDETRVRVGRTRAPLLLVLMNDRDTPTTWKVSRSADAHILGVIVLDDLVSGRGSRDALSFDPLRPAFLGEGHLCGVLVLRRGEQRPRNELRPHARADPKALSYNPFRLRGEPRISSSPSEEFSVGSIPPSPSRIDDITVPSSLAFPMTAWPNSRRSKAPTSKQ